MARPRRKTKSATKKTSTTRSAKRRPAVAASAAVLTCPECGKQFTRAASLGAHRNRAHGVTGASSRVTARRNSRATASRTRSAAIDRDALLQALFPQGIPARERVIRDVNAWLDQAERLARSA
jgi:uncharacterized C2H2 Zn-finger protein